MVYNKLLILIQIMLSLLLESLVYVTRANYRMSVTFMFSIWMDILTLSKTEGICVRIYKQRNNPVENLKGCFLLLYRHNFVKQKTLKARQKNILLVEHRRISIVLLGKCCPSFQRINMPVISVLGGEMTTTDTMYLHIIPISSSRSDEMCTLQLIGIAHLGVH